MRACVFAFLTLVPVINRPTVCAGPIADRDVAEVFSLLKKHCYKCHGAQRIEGGLRLDIRRLAQQGGDSGTVIVPGDASKSEFIRRLISEDDAERMPLESDRLEPEEIRTLRDWIVAGAKWPDEFAGREERSQHWAFQAILRPTVPDLQSADTAIDAFVLSQLTDADRTLSPPADRRTLMRRLSLDLLGLPPSPFDVDRFVADVDPLATEKLIDRLLASPHFGERWGRHWLDLARFAESDGYENDKIRANAFRFRDWVIDAINADVPFDQFTVDQLAGDLLPDASAAQKTATGFHRNTLWNSAASADKEEFRIRAVKDRAETTATVWMGLTLRCAQCHSHKYDPIAHREYYELYAFFNATDNDDVGVPGGSIPALKAVDRSSFVHRRGNFLDRGASVLSDTPDFLPPLEPRRNRSDRLDLARWIVAPQHPLTARVVANRIWQHLFGRGIVSTPENFGASGEPPTHPRLLDWIAAELRHVGWSRKRLIREVIRSATYRQSSHGPSDSREDHLLFRQRRFRVDAEVVRDVALSVSGLLNREIGGPSVVPPFPDGLLDHSLTNENLRRPGGTRFRRGVYIHVQRTLAFPTLAAFDVADGNEVCVRRDRSRSPMQALTLLNDPVFVECSRALAKRLIEVSPDLDERLRRGFRLVQSREPTETEIHVLRKLVHQMQTADDAVGQSASESEVWTGVARTLINLDGTITRD